MIFRNRRLVRATACLLLLETLGNLCAPFVATAAMGPSQPEFMGYEEPGATDMVNLATGDFTYQIPIFEVPGPERSFQLPLTYRAGIRLEQEASWVGLGWTLNPGAISRTVNGYPDDAAGDISKTSYECLYDRGWDFNLPGLFTLGWSALSGRYGSIDLIGLASVGWSGGRVSSGDIVGIRYAGEGKAVDPIRLACAAVTIASLGSAGAVTSAAGAAAKAGAIGTQVGLEVGKQAAMGVASSLFLGRQAGTSSGTFPVQQIRQEHFMGLSGDQWTFHDYETKELMYGSLYFGKMVEQTQPATNWPGPNFRFQSISQNEQPIGEFIRPTEAYGTGSGHGIYKGVGADYQQYVARDEASGDNGYYASSARPISISHDAFSIMGEGISGNARPQRLDIGCVSFPKLGTTKHRQFNIVPFLNDYKVGFRYENSLSNGYRDLLYAPYGSNDPSGFDIQHPASPGTVVLVNDPLLQNASRTPSDRRGLYGPDITDPTNARRRLVQGRHIAWYSNAEIQEMYKPVAGSPRGNRTAQGFMEYPGFPSTAPVQTHYWDWYKPYPQLEGWWRNTLQVTTNNPYRVQAQPNGIGAFAVTAEDGTTYHYSLPVYQYTQHTHAKVIDYAQKVRDSPEDGIQHAITGVKGPNEAERGPRQSYAAAWLLTAVTSPDYVDRNNNGVVDSVDWGGWVTLRYGRFTNRYKWQQPYIGMAKAMDGSTESFTEGFKETYYLNSISTRSHTALFIKSVRKDGRGHFNPDVTQDCEAINAGPNGYPEGHPADYLGIDQTKPSSSLKLDEIILLTNADYNKLRTPDGIIPADEGPHDLVPAFSTHTADNDTSRIVNGYPAGGTDEADLMNGDTYHNVFDQYDISADARINVFIKRRALKRVQFHYSYQLCPQTANSFGNLNDLPGMDLAHSHADRAGKLTLEAVSMYGPDPTYTGASPSVAKLTPDFIFEYKGPNPAYDLDKWDGFGMYSSVAPLNHMPSTEAAVATADGAAWSLTGVVSPLGGRTQIIYERDQYEKVSDQPSHQIIRLHNDNDVSTTLQCDYLDLRKYYQVGDVVHVEGEATYVIQCGTGPIRPEVDCKKTINYTLPISAITEHSLTLPIPFQTIQSQCVLGDCELVRGRSISLKIEKQGSKFGGDIRVAAINTIDEAGVGSSIHYRYDLRTPPVTPGLTSSSGVVSQEPDWIRDKDEPPISTDYDYPTTPVMYANVDVLRGAFRAGNPADWDVKEEYSFFTPSTSMINTPLAQLPLTSAAVERRVYHKRIDLGKIGQLQAVRKLNKRGEVEFASEMEYTNELPNQYNLAQGKFTEGAMLHDYNNEAFYRINRTTKEYVPTVMRSITTTSGGLTTKMENEGYDFYTGQVIATATTTSSGEKWHTLQIPAYMLRTTSANGPVPVYPTMGAKADDPANRNLLAQDGAAYTYLEAPGGPTTPFTPNLNTLLSASVQTWKNDWDTYRVWSPDPNLSNGPRYHDTAGSTIATAPDGPVAPVWRQYQSWIWNSPSSNLNGTYAGFTPFNWATGAMQANAWQEVVRNLRYDHYSALLETQNISRQRAAQRNGYGDYLPLAQASNAAYTEMAYSGAEDFIQTETNGTHRFGGEVLSKSPQAVQYAHTGQYSVAVAPGSVGFYTWLFPAKDGLERIGSVGARRYRASVWMRSASGTAPAGKLFVRSGINATPATSQTYSSTPAVTTAHPDKAGAWYLLNFVFSIPGSADAAQQLYIGCENPSTATETVYFDDFRFQPVEAPMTAYVYDPHTHQRTHTLDNDNLYTRTEYDMAGQVKRVYREVLDAPGRPGGERLVSERELNYRRWKQPTWVNTGSHQNAGLDPNGGRLVRWEEQNTNTASPSYGTLRLNPTPVTCLWCQ